MIGTDTGTDISYGGPEQTLIEDREGKGRGLIGKALWCDGFEHMKVSGHDWRVGLVLLFSKAIGIS